MRRVFQFALFLAALVPLGHATGGYCPAGANYLQESTNTYVTLSTLGVTSCVYVAANGSDSLYDGTTETISGSHGPWLHAPGMTACSSNCASFTMAAGVGIIFRGGDTWHLGNSSDSPYVGAAQWTQSVAGNSTNPVYIGFDPAWYSGGSWTQPALNGDNALWDGVSNLPSSCPTHDFSTSAGLTLANYNIFENIQVLGVCSGYTGTSANPMFLLAGDHDLIEYYYYHGWTVTQASTNLYGAATGINNGGNVIFTHYAIDGTDSPHYSASSAECTFQAGWPCATGQGFYDHAYKLEYGVCRYTANCGVLTDTVSIHDNLIEYLQTAVTTAMNNAQHADGYMVYSGTLQTFYNNVTRHNTATQIMYANVNSSGTLYLFNNTWYDNLKYGPSGGDASPSNCVNLAAETSGANQTLYVYNNTFDFDTDDSTGGGCIIQLYGTTGGNSLGYSWGGNIYAANNHAIGYSTLASLFLARDGTATYTLHDGGGNELQATSTARSQGYVQSTSPVGDLSINGSGSTIAAGVNETSECSTFSPDSALCSGTSGGPIESGGVFSFPAIPVAARPSSGAWDSEALQYVSGYPTLPQIWVDNLEPTDGLVYTAPANELKLNAYPATFTGPAASSGLSACTAITTHGSCTSGTCYFSSSSSCNGNTGVCPTAAGLQLALDDVEACRTALNDSSAGATSGFYVDIPPVPPNPSSLTTPAGYVFNAGGTSNGLVIPSTDAQPFSSFIILRSTKESSLPGDGTILCGRGIGDNTSISSGSPLQGHIHLSNSDCQGDNVYYELGPVQTTSTGASGISVTMSGSTATMTLASGTYPSGFTVGQIVRGTTFAPGTLNSKWQILSGGAGTSTLTAQACSFETSGTPVCVTGINSTANGALALENTITGMYTLSANTQTLTSITGCTSSCVPVLVPLSYGYVSPSGCPPTGSYSCAPGTYTTTDSNAETVTAVSGPNQSGILAVFAKSHAAGTTLVLCPSTAPCSYTLGDSSTVTLPTQLNDYQYLWQVYGDTNQQSDENPIVACSPTTGTTSTTATPPQCMAGSSPQTTLGVQGWEFRDMAASMYPIPPFSGPQGYGAGYEVYFGHTTNETSLAQLSNHIHLRHDLVFDNWLGTSMYTGSNTVTAGMLFWCVTCSVLDSQFSQILRPGGEGHMLGPEGQNLKIVNNIFDGASGFGVPGGYAGQYGPGNSLTSWLTNNYNPFVNVEMRNNLLTRPFPWLGFGIGNIPANINPNYSSSWSPTLKIPLELKSAAYVLIQGNIIENVDASASDAYGDLLYLRDCNSSGSVTSNYYLATSHDITVMNNVARNGCVGITFDRSNISPNNCAGYAWANDHVRIENNEIYNVSTASNPYCNGNTDHFGVQLDTGTGPGWTGTATANSGGTVTFVAATDNYSNFPIAGTSGTLTAALESSGTQVITSSGLFTNTAGGTWTANGFITYNGIQYNINSCSSTSSCVVACTTSGASACATPGSYSFTAIPAGAQAMDIRAGEKVPLVNCTGALSSINSPLPFSYGGESYPYAGYTVTAGSAVFQNAFSLSNVTVTFAVPGLSITPGTSDSTCAIVNIQSTPENVIFANNLIMTDNTYGIGNNQTLTTGLTVKGTGPNQALNNYFANSIVGSGANANGWGYNATAVGCATIEFIEDVSTFSMSGNVYPGQTSSNYTGCPEGNNPYFPIVSPTNYYPTETSMCSQWASPSLACSSSGTVQNLTVPDYHDFALNCSGGSPSAYCTGGVSGALIGPNIATIDTQQYQNIYVCTYGCGSPGPFPDVTGTVVTPTCSPAAGTYYSSQTVSCSSTTPGATICFTTNGATPTASVAGTCNGAPTQTYTGPATVAVSVTIKLLATLSGYTNSGVAIYPYVITTAPISLSYFGMQQSHAAVAGDNPPLNFPLADVPIGSVRIWGLGGLFWQGIEQSAGTYTWTTLDSVLAGYRANGQNDIFMSLGRVPAFYSSDQYDTKCDGAGVGTNPNGMCDPPMDLNADGTGTDAAFRNFIYALVIHTSSLAYLNGTTPYTVPHAHLTWAEIWSEFHRSDTVGNNAIGSGVVNISPSGQVSLLSGTALSTTWSGFNLCSVSPIGTCYRVASYSAGPPATLQLCTTTSSSPDCPAAYLYTAGGTSNWSFSISNCETTCAYRGTYAQMLRMAQDAHCIIDGHSGDSITALGLTCGTDSSLPGVAVDPGTGFMIGDAGPGTKQAPVMAEWLYCNATFSAPPPSGCPWSVSNALGSKATDAISEHPYFNGYGTTPEEVVPYTYAEMSSLSTLDAAKPFYVGEFSWGNGKYVSDPGLEAGFVPRAYILNLLLGVTRSYWFAYDESETSAATGGLWSYFLQPTFATNNYLCTTPDVLTSGYYCTGGIAYIQTVNWLTGATPTTHTCPTSCTAPTSGVFVYNISKSGGYQAAIVWDSTPVTSCSNPVCGTTAVPSLGFTATQWRDLAGVTHAGAPTAVGAEPIIIENVSTVIPPTFGQGILLQ